MEKNGFLVTQQQKFGAMGHQALLEHSIVLYKLFPLFIVCLMLLIAQQHASRQLSMNVYWCFKVHGTQCMYRAVSEHLSFQYFSLIKEKGQNFAQ